jgi:DNA polymerase-3 subunit alpha
MNDTFVHLHLHSEFSISDGIVRLGQLAEQCAEFRQPAVALTDWSNMYGAVKFYRACLGQGIKPIIGSDVWIENPFGEGSVDRVVLLCRDNQGYRNLSELLTRAYLSGNTKGRIVIHWDDFARSSAGLLCLLDDREGPVANLVSQDAEHRIEELLQIYQELFADRLYMAISRVGWPDEHAYINRVIRICAETGINPVATNRVEFLNQGEFEAHEIRVCINDSRVLDDSRRPRNFTDQQFLKSSQQMAELFSDLPAAINNSLEIARRCNLFFSFDQDYLPDFPDTGDQSEAEVLRELAQSGLAKRFGLPALTDDQGVNLVDREYSDRLEMELGVIEKMGYPGYFLIVADFIRWSREHGIPVGPGRGSGAGSLVAWSAGITEIDPLPYGLLFERFLNPERVSLPDFDIDFCVDGRDRVIEYVAERYGHDQVAQIITFGTMAAKAVVRDVGRVMGLPYGFVDQIAKLIPFEVGITLKKAMNDEQLFRERYEQEPEVQELIDAALQLEGIARNVGKHAGGVVIAPKPLTEYTPLYADTHLNQAITQFDKDDLEAIGLVKFDFLGLRTLTIIDSAVKLVNHQRNEQDLSLLEMESLPLDDEATYSFIRTGQTSAIFQLESRGMKELIIRAHPETFEDLIALIAMFRPGPLQSGMVEDFVKRKNGLEPVQHLHPDLESVLNTTYGVILYQEQVMQIAQILAGYTLGGADLLRKAMGKKQPEEMEKQREIFMVGAVNRGVDKKLAESIFNLFRSLCTDCISYCMVEDPLSGGIHGSDPDCRTG